MNTMQLQPNPLPFWALKRPDLISLKAPEPRHVETRPTMRPRRLSQAMLKKLLAARRRAKAERSKRAEPILEAVMRAVCDHYAVHPLVIKGTTKVAAAAWARFVYFAIGREMAPALNGDIARVVGRDRRIVPHAVRKVLAKANPEELETVRTLARREIRKIKQLAA